MNACITCAHVYRVDKNDQWFRWLCKQAPLPEWTNPVSGETVADPPYRTCIQVRRQLGIENECPAYALGPNVFNPREAA